MKLATSADRVSVTCPVNRVSRGANASMSTPTSAAPSTMKIGISAW